MTPSSDMRCVYLEASIPFSTSDEDSFDEVGPNDFVSPPPPSHDNVLWSLLNSETKPTKKQKKQQGKKELCQDSVTVDLNGARTIANVSDIIAIIKTTATDQICYIRPLNREIYVTLHKATLADLHVNMWLIKHGQRDCWYEASTTQGFEAGPSNHEHSGFQVSTATQGHALKCPEICFTDVLRSTSTAESEVKETMRLPGETGTLRYISVVRAFSGRPETSSLRSYLDSNLSSGQGTPIYKIVVTGSPEAARTTAFHNAGVYGHATLFTCVVHDRGIVGYGVNDLGPTCVVVGSHEALLNTQKKDSARRVVWI